MSQKNIQTTTRTKSSVTNSALALATTALFIANGLAFITIPFATNRIQVTSPQQIAGKRLNTRMQQNIQNINTSNLEATVFVDGIAKGTTLIPTKPGQHLSNIMNTAGLFADRTTGANITPSLLAGAGLTPARNGKGFSTPAANTGFNDVIDSIPMDRTGQMASGGWGGGTGGVVFVGFNLTQNNEVVDTTFGVSANLGSGLSAGRPVSPGVTTNYIEQGVNAIVDALVPKTQPTDSSENRDIMATVDYDFSLTEPTPQDEEEDVTPAKEPEETGNNQTDEPNNDQETEDTPELEEDTTTMPKPDDNTPNGQTVDPATVQVIMGRVTSGGNTGVGYGVDGRVLGSPDSIGISIDGLGRLTNPKRGDDATPNANGVMIDGIIIDINCLQMDPTVCGDAETISIAITPEINGRPQ